MLTGLFLLLLIFIGGPFLAVMILMLHAMYNQELNRPPTKEEWKQGKREKHYY